MQVLTTAGCDSQPMRMPSPPSPLSRPAGEGELYNHDGWNSPRPPPWERGWGEGTLYLQKKRVCGSISPLSRGKQKRGLVV